MRTNIKTEFTDVDGRHSRGRDHLDRLIEAFDREYERLGVSEMGGDRHKRERDAFFFAAAKTVGDTIDKITGEVVWLDTEITHGSDDYEIKVSTKSDFERIPDPMDA